MKTREYSSKNSVHVVAIIILYNPDVVAVKTAIKTYIDHVKYLYIIDNTVDTKSNINQLIDRRSDKKKVKLLHSGGNIGISKGINLGLHQAAKDNIQWLMTMDQDSSFPSGHLQKYFHAFNTALQQQSFGLFSLQHNVKFYKKNNCQDYYQDEIVMTSGSLVNVQQALTLQGFDEKLFIDEVDHEFCYRLIASGGRVLKTNCAYLKHSLGTLGTGLLGNSIRTYPPERLYYMVRNHFYVKARYKKRHSDILKKRQRYIISFVAKQIMSNTSSWLSLKYALKGYYDYRKNNMGQRLEKR